MLPMWHERYTCAPEIRKRRLAINLVWCLWLHFLIIIPACPWVLIAFWILIFDVACLSSIRPVCLFTILPNTLWKDECTESVPDPIDSENYPNFRSSPLNTWVYLKKKKRLLMIILSCAQLIWLGIKKWRCDGKIVKYAFSLVWACYS